MTALNRFHLSEISVRAEGLLRLPDTAALERLGVEREKYAELLYARTQEIGDAAQFLGLTGQLGAAAERSGDNLKPPPAPSPLPPRPAPS